MDKKETTNSNEKKYNAIKIRLTIIDLVISLGAMAFFSFSGMSKTVVAWLEANGGWLLRNDYLLFLAFIFMLGLVLSLVGLPLDYYGDYIVEKKFNLSNQTVTGWLFEKCKGLLVSLVIGVPVALVFFFLLRSSGDLWWLYFGIFMFVISVLLARIAPVLIFPLFYTFIVLEQKEIKEKIERLMKKYDILFKGIYSFNLSKNTKKANAAFTGIGKTKRIILSDTLVSDFTPDEVEVVFAHELGHYKKKHILKNLVFSTVAIFLSFFLCGTLYAASLELFGYSGIADVAALPLLALYLSFFSILIMPLTNAISRAYEREADAFALDITGNKEAFIASMEKLAEMNLADKEPHPVTEFMMYSHPSIKKRIEFAENYKK